MKAALFVTLISVLFTGSPARCQAPDTQTTTKQLADLKRVVVGPQSNSDSVIVVPPTTSVSVNLKNGKHSQGADAVDLPSWIRKESALNGLESSDSRPWHIVISWEQYDEDGDNVDSGVFEEFWVAPNKYKRIYKSDGFSQTDYASGKGLFRLGDQRWPKPALLEVRSEIVAPFSYAANLKDVHARNWERTFGSHKLQCIVVETNFGISDPTQYCFEPESSILRYTRAEFWHQIVYNRVEKFQGRNVAQEVDVTDGGKRYLELRVQTLEPITDINEKDFTPAPGAMGPLGERVSGVMLRPLKTVNPDWPTSAGGKQVEVSVQIVLGKDGRVISAKAVSGPPEYFKICEKAAKKWIYPVYRVLDKPVEVEQKISFSLF